MHCAAAPPCPHLPQRITFHPRCAAAAQAPHGAAAGLPLSLSAFLCSQLNLTHPAPTADAPAFDCSHFVKLAAPDEALAAKSMRELEAHSQVGQGLGGSSGGSSAGRRPGPRGSKARRVLSGAVCRLACPCKAARTTSAFPLPPQILDLMGFEPSHWNKVNIHIGG